MGASAAMMLVCVGVLGIAFGPARESVHEPVRPVVELAGAVPGPRAMPAASAAVFIPDQPADAAAEGTSYLVVRRAALDSGGAILPAGADAWRGTGAGGIGTPTLRGGEGISALPPWQRTAVITGGEAL
jgi:hypothetical protein